MCGERCAEARKCGGDTGEHICNAMKKKVEESECCVWYRQRCVWWWCSIEKTSGVLVKPTKIIGKGREEKKARQGRKGVLWWRQVYGKKKCVCATS